MNKKTINSILQRKFNQWLEAIDDEAIRNDVKENSIITGGSIVSLLMNEEPKDYDVYFTNKNTTKHVAQYYVDKFNKKHGAIKNKIGFHNKAFVLDGGIDIDLQLESLGLQDWGSYMLKNIEKDRIKIIMRSDGVFGEKSIETFEDVFDEIEEADNIDAEELEKEDPKEKYRPVFLSPNAVTLSDKIQIIIRFHGSPEEIHKNYDFVHCTNYWLSDGGKLFLNQAALECILSKELIYQGSKYPVCSVVRMRKFIKRGWHINAGQILKMLSQVSELDLTDISVLEDQLVGMDTAYFMQLIDALKERMSKDEEFKISTEYISTIVDRIFG